MFIRVSAGPVRVTVGDEVNYSPDVLDDIMARATSTVNELLPKYSENFTVVEFDEDEDEEEDVADATFASQRFGVAEDEDE